MRLEWTESEFKLWRIFFYGHLNFMVGEDADRTVFTIAEDVEYAISSLKTIHDRTPIIHSIKNVGLCIYQEERD